MSIPIGHYSSQCYQCDFLCSCASAFSLPFLWFVWISLYGSALLACLNNHMWVQPAVWRVVTGFYSSVLVKLWLYLENDGLHKLCINIHFILDCEKKICGETLFSILFDGYFKRLFVFQKQKYVYFSNHDHFWYPLEMTLIMNMSMLKL